MVKCLMVTNDVCRYIYIADHRPLLLSVIAHQARSHRVISLAINIGPWDSILLYSSVFSGGILYLIECLLASLVWKTHIYTGWSQWITTNAFILQPHQRLHKLLICTRITFSLLQHLYILQQVASLRFK